MSIVGSQYAEFLQEHHWDYFLTVTFRKPRMDPYYAIRDVWRCVEDHQATRGFLVAEPHISRNLHIHGIVSGAPPEWRPEIDLPWVIWNDCFHRFGRSKIDLVRSQGDVAGYCSKYVVKQLNQGDHYEIFGSKLDWT